MAALSARSYQHLTYAASWEEIWEAGPYYHRLSELLEDAQRYAIIAGWQIDSRIPMPRPARPGALEQAGMRETLREKVLRICEAKPDFHFYFLMWDHAYLYVPERELWQGRIWDTIHPRVHFIFDNRHPFGGAHHEKICIFDGTTALCGGIDLCDDRWDGPEHLYEDPRRSLDWKKDCHGPYHDLAVQVAGPICEVLREHLEKRWRSLSSLHFPGPVRTGLHEGVGHAVFLSRTAAGPRLVREIEFLFRDLIASAEHRIILEGQYFWSRRLTDMLVAKMHAMPKGFEIVIVLADLDRARSFTRKMATYEMTLLERLESAARSSGTRFVVGAPYSHSPDEGADRPPRPVYIHSKLMIIDDRFLCIGSANFNSRAMRIDTEVNLTLEARTPSERGHIRRVGERVLRHWGLRERPQNGIRLHRFHPRLRLREKRAPRPWRTWVPYQKFFDPPLPWGYAIKRRIHSFSKRKPVTTALLLASLSGAATIAVLGLSHAPAGWAWVYAALLSSAWLFPIPFFAVAILAAIQLGGDTGARIAVFAFWIASLCGYATARFAPSAFVRLLAGNPRPELHERMGRRTFEELLKILLDPRIEFRVKTAYQGLYCIPLPWFGLGNWIILPAFYWVACRAAAAWVPASWAAPLRQNPAAAVAVLLGWACIRNLMLLQGKVRKYAT